MKSPLLCAGKVEQEQGAFCALWAPSLWPDCALEVRDAVSIFIRIMDSQTVYL